MQKIIIANWKMQKTDQEAITWCNTNKEELNKLIENRLKIAICPSFSALDRIGTIIKNTQIKLGAQDCCPQERGAYTGDISALSLKEINCSYCIVGHSERRKYQCETDEIIAQKAEMLFKNNITPILCIGESQVEEITDGKFKTLEHQLNLTVNKAYAAKKKLYIAYEPSWAIGSGQVPSVESLYKTVNWIQNYITLYFHGLDYSLLYGGSVNESTIQDILNVHDIEGFLLGGASLDFQTLKKIVLLL